MQDFTQTEVGGDTLWIQFQSMLEVLGCLLGFSRVGLKSGQMKTGTEVLLINQQALLEQLDRLLVVLFLLINDTKVIISVDVSDWLLKGFLIAADCLLNVSALFQDTTHTDQSIWNVLINPKGSLQIDLCLIEGLRFS